MKFRFIGDPRHNGEGSQEVEMLGHAFNRKDWTEVTDEAVVRRLEGNAHFEKANGAPMTTGAEADIPPFLRRGGK